MREYQHKHVIRQIFYSKVTIVVLFLVLILLLRSIMELNEKRIGVAKLRSESEVKRLELEEKVSKAKEKNDYIETERGFEEYVRTTEPVVKDGEGVIVIYDAQKSLVTPVRKEMNIWEDLTVWLQKVLKK